MTSKKYVGGRLHGGALAALVLMSWPMLSNPSIAAAPSPSRAGIPVTAPDMSSYDCTGLTSTTPVKTVHIGQVISGRYYEWNEIYRTDGNGAKLACIGLLVPAPQQLDATHAQAFIAHSAAIGAPTEAAPAAGASVNTMSIEPANVKPEPLKHLLRGTAGNGTTKPTPPIPATKSNTQPSAETPGSGTATPPQNSSQSTPQGSFQSAPSSSTLSEASTTSVTQVSTTTSMSYPWNTVGYLSVTYPDGESFRCSGTQVSPYVVLTAGHCVQNSQRGGYVSTIRFYPGQNTTSQGVIQTPYGVQTRWTNIQVTQAWSQISGPDSFEITDYASDFAAIQFATPVTYTSTFMPIIYESVESPVTNAGYPATIDSQSGTVSGLYAMIGDEDSDSLSELEPFNVREFSIESAGGDSGSPFWLTDSLGRTSLVGSLSYGSSNPNVSGGPWYNYWNYQLLSNWVAWTPGATSISSLPTDGMHIGSVFSTAQNGEESYLRFYNIGGTAGDITLTLENYLTGATLATWTSPSIPPNAELQFGIDVVESQASASFQKPPFYSLSIRPGITGYFQHVLYHPADGTLTNLSTCDSGTINNSELVVGVHSSLLSSGFPSTVVVYNTGASGVPVQLGIYDARNGNQIGTYTTPLIPASGQAMLSAATIEAAIGVKPTGNEYHYIIEILSAFTGYLQNLVNNEQAGVVTDMSAMCILPPA